MIHHHLESVSDGFEKLSVVGSFSLSSGGDQILIFSGSEEAPSFMCGLNFEGTGASATKSDHIGLDPI